MTATGIYAAFLVILLASVTPESKAAPSQDKPPGDSSFLPISSANDRTADDSAQASNSPKSGRDTFLLLTIHPQIISGTPGPQAGASESSRSDPANSAQPSLAQASGSAGQTPDPPSGQPSGSPGGSQTQSTNKAPDPDQSNFAPIKLLKRGVKGFLREQDTGPMICTDRNSVTPHPNVVPLGYLQFENGMTLDKFRKGGDFILPETVARLGTWPRGELRFQVPNYVRSSTLMLEGTSDIQVSVKQEIEPHLLNKRGFDLGVIGGMSLPTGSRYLSTRSVDPFVQMIAFYKFHEKHTLGTSHSIFMPSQVQDDPDLGTVRNRDVTYQPTVILFRHSGDFVHDERVDIWAEWAGQFYEQGPSSQIIDFGGVWRPYQCHQLDFRFGFGLSSAAPRAFIGMGYSWLAGKVIPFYKKHPDHLYRP